MAQVQCFVLPVSETNLNIVCSKFYFLPNTARIGNFFTSKSENKINEEALNILWIQSGRHVW